MLFAITVRVRDSGLPEWQEAILSVVGVLLAFALLYGLYKLTQLPKERRFRRRVQAVETAAGDHPVFGAATVRPAMQKLYRRMQSAWDAADRERLASIGDPGIVDDWLPRLDRDAAQGVRYRVDVLKGPEVDYVGLHGSTDGYPGHFVRLRLRAKLRAYFESPDGKRTPVPEGRGSQKFAVEEYWTLSRRDGEWIMFSSRGPELADEYLNEEVVGPRD